MSDHIPDAGDPDATPIMDAVDVKCDELNVMDAICYAVYEGQKLEIQLNEANARIQRLEEALDKTTKIASKHIKQLEEAGDAVAAIIGPPGSAHWADENQVDAAWNNWLKAKEAK